MADSIKYAFRITHIDNIPHIIRYGLLRANSPYIDTKNIAIGDEKVILKREDLIFNNVRLNDCVPFYFGPRSPMLYVIQNGYNGVVRRKPEEIVYCVIRIEDIIKGNIECVFTNGHALSALTEYFDGTQLNELNNLLNYNDVYAAHWNSDIDIDLKRRKEAELLIKEDLAPEYIRGFVVYNDLAKEKLMGYGVPEGLIVVSDLYYF